MYLTIDTITHSRRDSATSIDVHCTGATLRGDKLYVVRISHCTVTVYAVDDSGNVDWNGDVNVGDVSVAPDLIAATRRLFGLVGTV